MRTIDQYPSIWARYTDFKAKQLNPNTIQRDYNRIARMLKKVPPYVVTAIDMRDWLLSEYSAETARRTLQKLDACGRWAVRSDLLRVNMFADADADIRKTAHNRRESFSRSDRDAIIAGFRLVDPFFFPFVAFLFGTGCRFEEAAGLEWGSVAQDLSFLQFRQAVSDTGLKTPIKTDEVRAFPCNQIIDLLQAQSEITLRRGFVFPSLNGTHISGSNFRNRHWAPLVKRLVSEGKVYRYLPAKNCRHTFITLAIESQKLTINEIAALAGNKPHTIYTHYASKPKISEMPTI